MTIIHGDCLEVMKTFPDNHFSAVVTDPPYGLSFMGKGWDYQIPGVEYWMEVFRVLKPGGHLLAMGGTRTFHRQICAIEDAGFEIRDCLMWIYGSGFPKSHNIGKALDKENGTYVEGEISANSRASRSSPSGCYSDGVKSKRINNPQSPMAKMFDGYGTALKPAHEPITMAMKSVDGTFAQNAQTWGQAGINIDGCRVGPNPSYKYNADKNGTTFHGMQGERMPQSSEKKGSQFIESSKGRWPANVIFDEEAGRLLDEQSGMLKSGEPGSRKKEWTGYATGLCTLEKESGFGDSGGASRFFKCIEKDCFLCYNPCLKAEIKECKNTDVHNANQNLKITQAINQSIVPENVNLTPEEQFAQNVKYAGNLCDLCAMNIARGLVAIRISDSNKKELQATLGYIGSYKSSILIQNLASFAELWGNIDIIPTIGSLSILFGSVHHAIENCTKQENDNQNGKNEQSRFLYCAKASSRERNEGLEEFPDAIGGGMCSTVSGDSRTGHITVQKNNHPTVKPIKLMEYLIKLVMPPCDGLLLDPFAGSGTTILAAKRLGFDAIGIEKQKEYVDIANARISAPPQNQDEQLDLLQNISLTL